MKSFLFAVTALFSATAFAIFSVAPQFATADEYSQAGEQSSMEKKMEDMPMGMHSMGGTVESINHKTGWMKLKTGVGEMTIHYPPQAIKDLNKGDKITANLSFTKEEGKKEEMMKMK